MRKCVNDDHELKPLWPNDHEAWDVSSEDEFSPPNEIDEYNWKEWHEEGLVMLNGEDTVDYIKEYKIRVDPNEDKDEDEESKDVDSKDKKEDKGEEDEDNDENQDQDEDEDQDQDQDQDEDQDENEDQDQDEDESNDDEEEDEEDQHQTALHQTQSATKPFATVPGNFSHASIALTADGFIVCQSSDSTLTVFQVANDFVNVVREIELNGYGEINDVAATKAGLWVLFDSHLELVDVASGASLESIDTSTVILRGNDPEDAYYDTVEEYEARTDAGAYESEEFHLTSMRRCSAMPDGSLVILLYEGSVPGLVKMSPDGSFGHGILAMPIEFDYSNWCIGEWDFGGMIASDDYVALFDSYHGGFDLFSADYRGVCHSENRETSTSVNSILSSFSPSHAVVDHDSGRIYYALGCDILCARARWDRHNALSGLLFSFAGFPIESKASYTKFHANAEANVAMRSNFAYVKRLAVNATILVASTDDDFLVFKLPVS